jgi:protein-glutamine gamma-glutamyltransferase
LGLALAAALALASLWIVWQTRRETAIRPRDRLGSSYADLQRRLARAGWARRVHEGPLAYARRVAGARPDLADELERLCTRYAELRYGLAPTPAQIDALSAQMAAFRVRAIKPKLPPQTAR